jgi:hypothetical protein
MTTTPPAGPMDLPVERLERAELARRMGIEAMKAMLREPCKKTPALDDAIKCYLAATKKPFNAIQKAFMNTPDTALEAI